MAKSKGTATQPADSAAAAPVKSNQTLKYVLGAVLIGVIGMIANKTISISNSNTTLPQTHALLPTPPHWGTYRPNLYLGVRGVWPTSPLFGWLWTCATPESCGPEQQINELRHDAEERDGVTKYGWLEHNGENYGRQGIVDKKMSVNFTTSFIRPAEQADRWTVRIEANPIGSSKEEKSISLYFYTSLASDDHTLELLNDPDSTGLDEALGIRLHAGEEASDLTVRADLASGSKASHPSYTMKGQKRTLDRTYFYGEHIDLGPPSAALQRQQQAGQAPPQQFTWAAKEVVKNVLTEQYRSIWQEYQSASTAAQRAHESKHRGVKNPPQFVPPPVPTFVSTLPNTIQRNSNILVIQRVLTLPFTMDFVMQPTELDNKLQQSPSKEVGGTDQWFDGKSLRAALNEQSESFQSRFTQIFPLKFASNATDASKRAEKEFAQALLSNMLGGIGYFQGSQLIEDAPARPATNGKPAVPAKIRETSPSELFSAVPSRSFFPRGFMWDEGFHELLISTWSLDLSLTILGSWFSQIQTTSTPPGWLPREQILGSEARKRVPSEFQAQKPTVANPPTLILALEKILNRLKQKELKEKAAGGVTVETKRQMALFDSFLATWLPTLHMHVQWFFSTQASSVGQTSGIQLTGKSDVTHLPLSFRWAGRTLDHCLASGLDDYPRAKFLPQLDKDKVESKIQPAQRAKDAKAGLEELANKIGVEGHVDLHAWMIVLAKTMAGLTDYLHSHQSATTTNTTRSINYDALSSTYSTYAAELSRTLFALHWNPTASSFADYAYRNGTRHFVSHIGYVSLLPLFLTVLDPTSPELLAILQQLQSDEWAIWTRHGLRSLSSKDKYFGSKEDYWRGHIWINMQYLASQALTYYGQHPSSPTQVQELATRLSNELRTNVGKNVASEYRRTGYVWEQYHALDGKGRKSHPFTGWTALTLLIMTEE